MFYVFYGDDSFGIKEALDELRAGLDTDGSLETNTMRFSARDASLQEVLSACDTAPFLGDIRLVVVEGMLSGAPRRGRKKAAPEDAPSPGQPLLEYVPRMPASTTLVLIETSVPDVAALKKLGEVRHFKLPEKAGIVAWVRARAQKTGLRIEPRAMGLLADLVGNDLWLLSNEMRKLAAFAGEGTVREADVRELVHAARELKFWTLTDAVGEGKAAQALKVLQELRAQNEDDQALLGSIRDRLRRLAVARSMIDAGEQASAIGRRLGTSGYALERLVDQASRWSADALRDAYACLVQAEMDVKQGVLDQELALDLAVHDVASLNAARRAA